MTETSLVAPPEQAAILVGGLGSRLGPLTDVTPKPLLEVGGKPFLDYLIDACMRFGFRDLLLLGGFAADQLARYVESTRRRLPVDVTLELIVEPSPRGTAGAIRYAAGRLAERFILLNGDSFFDVNWLDVVLVAQESPDSIVMALSHQADTSRFGVVRLEDDRVAGFTSRGSGPGLINAGLYRLDRSTVCAFPEEGSLEEIVLPSLATQGRVRGRAYAGLFVDIGIPQSLAHAQSALPQCLRKPAAFLDRDGTVVVDTGYVHKTDDLSFLPGAMTAIKRLNDIGYYVFLVTNQSGVAKGFFTETDVRAFHAEMQRRLRITGAHIDDVRYCPHHPDGRFEPYRRQTSWRKPGPGMLIDLMRSWPILRDSSVLVGDKETDMSAAQAANLRGLHYNGGDLDAFLMLHLPPTQPSIGTQT
jgi:D,D-heptose 1,7-bisphosphate phosphatase